MSHASSIALLACLIGTRHAVAQTCRGFESFRTRPLQLSAGTEASTGVRAYALGGAIGGAGPFAGIELGGIDVEAFSGSSRTKGGSVGYQVSLNPRRTAELCPTVDVLFLHGPEDINGTGVDYTEHDVSVGVAAGIRATRTGASVVALPTGSLTPETATATLSNATRVVSTSRWVRVRVGLGLVLGQELSIRPEVSRPLASNATTTFGIAVAFAFGGHQPRAMRNAPTSCAGLASTDSTVYDTSQVTERAKIRTASEPWYPPMERDRGVEGRVILSLVVSPTGVPDLGSVKIAEGVDTVLDRQSLRWIRTVSYWPACYEGRPVGARVTQPVDFCAFGCKRRKS